MQNDKFLLNMLSIFLIGSSMLGSYQNPRKNMWQGSRFLPSMSAVNLEAAGEESDFLQAMGAFMDTEMLDQDFLAEIKKGDDRANIVNALQSGANPNAKDRKGNFALDLAVMYNRPEIVRLLLQAGAEPVVFMVDLDEWAQVAGLDSFGSETQEKIWRDRASAMNIVHDFSAVEFKPIEKHFSKEPSPMDYAPEGASLEDESYDEYESAIYQFEKDHKSYWRNKLQEAYKSYLYENPRPLIDLLSNEVYERPGLMQVIDSLFREGPDDSNDFDDNCSFCSDLSCSCNAPGLSGLERLMESAKGSMTSEEIAKIQTLIDSESEINRNIKIQRINEIQESAAAAIQNAWSKHKASSNRLEKAETYKKALEMRKQPFGTVDNYDLDL